MVKTPVNHTVEKHVKEIVNTERIIKVPVVKTVIKPVIKNVDRVVEQIKKDVVVNTRYEDVNINNTRIVVNDVIEEVPVTRNQVVITKKIVDQFHQEVENTEKVCEISVPKTVINVSQKNVDVPVNKPIVVKRTNWQTITKPIT